MATNSMLVTEDKTYARATASNLDSNEYWAAYPLMATLVNWKSWKVRMVQLSGLQRRLNFFLGLIVTNVIANAK